MEGVGGSDRTPVEAETGKVKPTPFSEDDVARNSPLVVEINGNECFVP